MRIHLVAIPLITGGVAISATLLFLSACGSSSSSSSNSNGTPPPFNITSINHVVVIYQENWSFDSQYSQFPGANGIAFGTPVTQTSIPVTTGTPLASAAYTAIPQPVAANGSTSDTTNFANWPMSTGPAAAAPQPPQATQPVAFFNIQGTPFNAAPDFVSSSTITGDIVHRFYMEQLEIDGGLNDRFLAWSDNPGLVLSAYDATTLPIGQLAKQYTLCDAFFHSAFGGSFLNHQYLISAQAPYYGPIGTPPTLPPKVVATSLSGYPNFVQIAPGGTTVVLGSPSAAPAQVNSNGNDWPAFVPGSTGEVQDGQLITAVDAADPAVGNGAYYCVNTMYPVNWPFPTAVSNGAVIPSGKFVPLQTHQTIGDLLTAAGQSWKWYSQGWNDAVAGNPDVNFQYHHQAFNYYAQFAPGTPGRVHLADTEDLDNDLATNTLPAVSFVKFLGENNEHPGYTDILNGQQAVADLVAKIQSSPAWGSTAIFITYDEHGGRWDHVNPLTYPNADKWGPGLRVPCIVISPYAKQGFVDHTPMETVSILSFIEKRWGLGTIPSAIPGQTLRDVTATPFTNSFQGQIHANN